MEEIHKISDANTGSVLKQGDTTELKFKLYDANDDNIDHILNKPAEVVFLANGEVYYRTEGNVDDLYICTFTIDEVLPKGMYHIEFIVEGGIYPSGDKPYFTITRSSMGKDLNTIQAYGFEDLVIRTTEEVSKRLEDMVTEIEKAESDRQAQEEARGEMFDVKEAERQAEFNANELERDRQTSLLNDATGTRLKYWAGSQAQYDAIGTYDLDTVYDIW